jgi:phosphotransferase system HPr (HPr) family protein
MACKTVTESFSLSQQQSQDAMNGEILRRKVIVQDPLGFHMRPLTVFAQRAGQFQCTVIVCKDDQRVNGKSPLELMLLAAQQGTELTLEVSGADAQAAIDVLAELLAAPVAEENEDRGSKIEDRG